EPLEPLVAARDVEDDVVVRRETVARKKVLERCEIVARLVALGAELELDVGFVCIVGARAGRETDRREREKEREHTSTHVPARIRESRSLSDTPARATRDRPAERRTCPARRAARSCSPTAPSRRTRPP